MKKKNLMCTYAEESYVCFSAVLYTCFIEAGKEEEETYDEVKALHSCSGFIVLTGA